MTKKYQIFNKKLPILPKNINTINYHNSNYE